MRPAISKANTPTVDFLMGLGVGAVARTESRPLDMAVLTLMSQVSRAMVLEEREWEINASTCACVCVLGWVGGRRWEEDGGINAVVGGA